MVLQRKVESLINEVRRFGIFRGCLSALIKGINKLIYFKVFSCLRVNTENLTKRYSNLCPKCYCCFLNIDEMSELFLEEEYDLSKDFSINAFNNGDMCFGVFYDNKLASYAWYSRRPTKVNDDLELSYNRNYLYHYKAFTHPKYRGLRLHAMGMMKAVADLNKNGAPKWLVALVEIDNFSSLKSFHKLGYREIGKMLVFGVWRKYFIFKAGDCSKYSLELKC